MIESKVIRCDPSDPDRCQGHYAHGQCPYLGEFNGYCARCYKGGKTEQKEKLRNYRLSQWQARVSEFADNDKIKVLNEEIGILRLILETTLQQCTSPNDVLMYSPKISDLVTKIERTVLSFDRLERIGNEQLSKAKVLQLAGTMVDIISTHIKDEDVINSISDDILVAITKTVGGGT